MTPAQFWTDRLNAMPESSWWLARTINEHAQTRREKAKFNTGSITDTAAVALMALAQWARPKAVVEVGTFIGVSTLSLAGEYPIYTCDVSNDCLEPTKNIVSFPYQTSTEMLRALAKRRVKADLFFFDGLLSRTDCELIMAVSAPDAVYVFDDYNGRFKGVIGVELLTPWLEGYRLIPADGPVKDDTTLAVLAPESRL